MSFTEVAVPEDTICSKDEVPETWKKIVTHRKPHSKRQSQKMLRSDSRDDWDASQGDWDASQGDWDEETQGDQVVYDASYECNEDLVPWRQERCMHWGIERWGLYA